MIKKTFIILLLMGVFCLFALNSIIALPTGVTNVSQINTSSPGSGTPDSHDAIAGNVTELGISGLTSTQSWQGYSGNITGVIQLADSASHVMYNWSQLNPNGEIYASKNATIAWSYIQCFNYTANGTYCDEDINMAGGTSICGMNLTQLEAAYNISTGDSDSVNNTFALNNHAAFYTNNLEFTSGECKNMKVFNSTGVGDFDEALMYEPTGRSVVFTSILKSNANGFDGKTHDFEMLVLEDGHYADVATTKYYFYMEIA